MAINNYYNDSSTNSSRMLSIYRMSDAQPDWAETDPSQPDFIKNKELAEKFRPIIVNGEIFLDDSYESGNLNLVSGDNIVLRIVNNSLEISSTGNTSSTSVYDIISENPEDTAATLYYLTKDGVKVETPIVVPNAYDDSIVLKLIKDLENSTTAQNEAIELINTNLAKKIDSAFLFHTSETNSTEGCFIEGTALKFVVDTYTKQEVRDYVAEAIKTVTGGETAGEVLALLNEHVAIYEAKIADIDKKDKEQDNLITKLTQQVNELANNTISNIPIATVDAVGGIKSAMDNSDSTIATNKVYIDASTGVGEIKAFSTDNLVQGTKMLILNGGDIDIVI